MSKYRRWHDQIIEGARTRVLRSGYYEKHHIQPRSAGGNDEKSNVVKLTFREHFLVHWLLTKFTSGEEKKKMAFALHRMTHPTKKARGLKLVASWQYAVAKKASRDALMGNKFNVGKVRTAEQRKRISEVHRGNKYNVGKKRSEEAIRKQSATLSGRPKSPEHIEAVRRALTGLRRSEEAKAKMHWAKSEEHKQKIREALAGRIRSEESRAKQSAAMKGRPKSQETRERMAAAARARWVAKRNGNPPKFPSRPSRLTSPRPEPNPATAKERRSAAMKEVMQSPERRAAAAARMIAYNKSQKHREETAERNRLRGKSRC